MEFKGEHALVSSDALENGVGRLAARKDALRKIIEARALDVPESFLSSVFLPDALLKARAIKDQLGVVKHVFLIGIGGSSLGTEAVYEALPTTGTLHVFDSINPYALARFEQRIADERPPLSECAVCIVSKSGATTETLFNANVVLSILDAAYGTSALHRVIVMSERGSSLLSEALEEGFKTVELSPSIGGRFSVFSESSIVPLALLGVDVEVFLSAGKAMLENTILKDDDSPLRSAALINAHSQSSLVFDTFLFDERLLAYGRWYRQLLGESLGKEVDKNLSGLIPTVSTAEDLHSMGQLYLSGDRGILTGFHRTTSSMIVYADHDVLLESSSTVYGRGSKEVGKAIEEGVLEAYRTTKLPYLEYILQELSVEELGSLMMFRLLETLFLAELGKVDPFGQPNVELYKSNTRRILSGQ